jgi:hypothetical protein
MSDKIIYFRESLLQSVLGDLSTFGMLCGSVWFNHAYVGGSYFLNGVILVMFIIFLMSKVGDRKSVFTSKEELIKHLQSETTPPKTNEGER